MVMMWLDDKEVRLKNRHGRPVAETPGFIAMLERCIDAAGRRVAKADPEELAMLIQLRNRLDRAIQVAVDGQRSTGITWESIGQATGTTRQAAIQKWGSR